jgi:hypothetical protein
MMLVFGRHCSCEKLFSLKNVKLRSATGLDNIHLEGACELQKNKLNFNLKDGSSEMSDSHIPVMTDFDKKLSNM